MAVYDVNTENSVCAIVGNRKGGGLKGAMGGGLKGGRISINNYKCTV